jgi:hypothetical protein
MKNNSVGSCDDVENSDNLSLGLVLYKIVKDGWKKVIWEFIATISKTF